MAKVELRATECCPVGRGVANRSNCKWVWRAAKTESTESFTHLLQMPLIIKSNWHAFDMVCFAFPRSIRFPIRCAANAEREMNVSKGQVSSYTTNPSLSPRPLSLSLLVWRTAAVDGWRSVARCTSHVAVDSRCTIQCGVHTFCAFLMATPPALHHPPLPGRHTMTAKDNIAKELACEIPSAFHNEVCSLSWSLSRIEFRLQRCLSLSCCSSANTVIPLHSTPLHSILLGIDARLQSNHNIMKHAMPVDRKRSSA